jgi:hypothetical protein
MMAMSANEKENVLKDSRQLITAAGNMFGHMKKNNIGSEEDRETLNNGHQELEKLVNNYAQQNVGHEKEEEEKKAIVDLTQKLSDQLAGIKSNLDKNPEIPENQAPVPTPMTTGANEETSDKDDKKTNNDANTKKPKPFAVKSIDPKEQLMEVIDEFLKKSAAFGRQYGNSTLEILSNSHRIVSDTGAAVAKYGEKTLKETFESWDRAGGNFLRGGAKIATNAKKASNIAVEQSNEAYKGFKKLMNSVSNKKKTGPTSTSGDTQENDGTEMTTLNNSNNNTTYKPN